VDTAAFERMLSSSSGGITLARTSAGHMGAGGAARGGDALVTPDHYETTIDGNAVVLEEQMARAAETRMQFETGIALYQKGLELMRMAARAPGR
jgi:flagellar basal-body rod protein FlgB